MNPDSQAEIRALLDERGLSLKKRWGQNFLVNRGARERLVSHLQLSAQARVWEIGPGLGSMTDLLLEKAAEVVAFEVDRGLCRYLRETHGERESFFLVEGDFLETWRQALVSRGAPDALLGNLPYRSASLMIADMIVGCLRPARMVFTVQRELAERMAAQPGTKSYSSFSVLCQSVFRVETLGDLKPGSFYPAPDVVSSIIGCFPRPDAPDERVISALSAMMRGLFASRRKTIRNNLAQGRLGEGISSETVLQAMQEQGIDLGKRAEELAPDAFVRLAQTVAGRDAGGAGK